MTITEATQDHTEAATTAEGFAERLLTAALGAQEVQATYLGLRLGWYEALDRHGSLTPGELAELTDSDTRYAQEWLEHQAVCGYMVVDDADAPADVRRFALPTAHAEALLDEDSPVHLAPIARMVAGLGQHLDALVSAYRTGRGLSWQEMGDEVREGQAGANRPLFLHQLGDLLHAVPELARRLQAGGRIADVGTGHGWSAIGLARAFPDVTVDGFDIDVPSIEAARRNAGEHGVADRVRFHVADGGDIPAATGPYDAVFAFECIHDLADPVGVLATMRRLAGDDGVVVVMDERVADRFAPDGDEVERLLYGFSITCCLPDGRSHEHSAATGTVMRTDVFTAYAEAAGFSGVDVLPIEHDMFRFYRLQR